MQAIRIRYSIITLLAVGLVAGSAVAVTAQDEGVESTSPSGPASGVETDALGQPSSGSVDAGVDRVIELDASDHRFVQDGELLEDIVVVPGETVVFRVDNAEGVTHNFYIGTEEELRDAPNLVELLEFVETEKAAGRDPGPVSVYPTTDAGIPEWETGVRELAWQVPDDVVNLKFGCTMPSHYARMQGTISVAS